MRVYPSNDYLGAEICFLLEVDIKGTMYRFSSFPIEIMNNNDVVFYSGLLSDPEYAEQFQEIGKIKLSTNSISMSLIFPFDVAKREMSGKTIEYSKAVLSYVTISKNRVQQSFDNVINIFAGVIKEPIYGHPTKEKGYVEFSIENEIYVNDSSLLSLINKDLVMFDTFVYSPGSFTGAGQILNIEQNYASQDKHHSVGKIVPAIIGSPGISSSINGTVFDYPATPAYRIGSFADLENPTIFFLLVAGHYCLGDTVTIQDNQGNKVTNKTVFNSTSGSGQMFAYVVFDQNELDAFDFDFDEKFEYYIRWTDASGAVSPYTGTSISNAGDFLIFVFESLNIDYDREAFQILKSILNEYKFSGYINDVSIKAYEFVQKYIIPFLPITLSTGAKGVYPVLDYRIAGMFESHKKSITTSALFERVSAISPSQKEIINEITVQYAPGFVHTTTFDMTFGGIDINHQIGGNDYRGVVHIGSEFLESIETEYQIVSPYSRLSKQIYGTQKSSIALEYVSDRATAVKIGLDIIRRKCLPEKICTYRAAFHFGHLLVGDVIELTDLDIGMSQSKVQIIGKTYESASWLYDIMFQDNPIDNQRVVE